MEGHSPETGLHRKNIPDDSTAMNNAPKSIYAECIHFKACIELVRGRMKFMEIRIARTRQPCKKMRQP
jgi:hypothetical protein